MRTQRRRIGHTAAVGLLAAAVVVGAAIPALAEGPDPGRGRAPQGKERAVAAERRGGGFRTVKKTFANGSPIAVPAVGAQDEFGPADPYPSGVQVSGFRKARVADVNVTLRGLSHPFPSDVAVLLVAPGGRNAVLVDDAGRGGQDGGAVDVALTLDDEAAGPLPTEVQITSGSFRPTDRPENAGTDLAAFPAPAPAASGNSALSTFDGINPNGEWRLFVMDDESGDAGEVAEGWALEITAKSKAKKRRR